MAKKNLTLKELFSLQEEIKEVMTKSISILARYKISELKKTVDETLVLATETKDDLIRTFGEEDENKNINLKIYLDAEEKVMNPKFVEFYKEWDLVLAVEKEISYSAIHMDLIKDIQTEKPIEVLFKFLED
ncbi:MAG: hypothetical protein ABIP51_03165 [Bacteroidia bacterium]